MWQLSDIERRLANIVKIAVISEVNHSDKLIRVSAGDIQSAWLPWPADVGKNYKRWRPLRQGQQVVLVSPSGDLSQAVIVGMLYSNVLDSPSDDENLDLIEYDDGTVISYDSDAHKLTIDCVSDVHVNAVNASIDATALDITAEVSINGNVNVVGDVVADGISLKSHTHSGVVSGGALSGPPAP